MMQLIMMHFPHDPRIPLRYLRQIPRLVGVASVLGDIPPDQPWTVERVMALREQIEQAGLRWLVVESIPVHESIKLGAPDRDRFIDVFIQGIEALGAAGIPILCYNFMPGLGWTRTDLAMPMPDGSTALAFDQNALANLERDDAMEHLRLTPERRALIAQYAAMTDEDLFANYVYFINAVVPAAERANVKLAIHPDDPPWSIMGTPRIVRDADTVARLLAVNSSPYHGLTFCAGSLGANPANDLPAMARQFADRIHFIHARRVKTTGDKVFHEVAHADDGDVDLFAVLDALIGAGVDAPLRPDHGRMIWDEDGIPGYGLYDRALGAQYLIGLIEAIERKR